MRKNSFILWGLFALLSSQLAAQDFTQLGILPRINQTEQLSDRWGYNFSAFSEIAIENESIGTNEFPSRTENLTFILIGSFKFNLRNVYAAGYLFRINRPYEDESGLEHRFLQFYTHISHTHNIRFRHTFRHEERFIESFKTGEFNRRTRLSYSLGIDFPLEGFKLDPKEFYINSVTSFFAQPTRPKPVHNLTEFYLGLGYKTKKIGRFEIGPEFKINILNENRDRRTLMFIDLIWYLSLDLI